MASIFLSYSRKNTGRVKELIDDLQELGHRVWIDNRMPGGVEWWKAILDEVRDADIFVYALTRDSAESPSCRREFGYACPLNKHIVPVKLEEVSLSHFSAPLPQIQVVPYLGQDRREVAKLAGTISALGAPAPLPHPSPERPDIPVTYLDELSEKVRSPSLTQDEQAALLIKLKQHLDDADARADALELLRSFRSHSDSHPLEG